MKLAHVCGLLYQGGHQVSGCVKYSCEEEGLDTATMAVEPWSALLWHSIINSSSGKLIFSLASQQWAAIGSACLWLAASLQPHAFALLAGRSGAAAGTSWSASRSRSTGTSAPACTTGTALLQASPVTPVRCPACTLCGHERDCLGLLLI